jgi:hypothetical protein
MKTIVVPLDFSEESLSGLSLALMMADKTHADIELVHIISLNQPNEEYLRNEHLRATENFEQILQKYKLKIRKKLLSIILLKKERFLKRLQNFQMNLMMQLRFCLLMVNQDLKSYLLVVMLIKLQVIQKIR